MSPSPPEPLPPVLYHYYGPERIDVLESGMLRFNGPNKFNDTFDSEFRSLADNPKARVMSKVDRVRYRSRLGIYCLTEDPDNHVMWVNYAKQHKGFVIGFNMTDPFWSENGVVPSKVMYVPSPPKLASGNQPSVQLSLLKSDAWSYEKEWRAVRSFENKESRDIPYGTELLSQIIIGSEMEHYHTAQLLDVIGALSSDSPIELFDSKPNREQWKFEHVRSTKEVCTKCSGNGYTTR